MRFPFLLLLVALLIIEICHAQNCEGKICGDDGAGGSCGSCQGHQVCAAFGSACSPPSDEGLYRVGVDYHSTTDDFSNRDALHLCSDTIFVYTKHLCKLNK